MTSKEHEIERLKKITGVTDFENASPEDVAKIDKMAAQGKLNLEQMKLLVEAIPHFVELQKTTIKALQDTVAAARDVQKEAIQSVGNSLNAVSRILEQLADTVQTDDARMKLAEIAIEIGRFGLEMAKILERMNKDNNSLWKWITGAVVTAAAAVVIIFVASGDDSSET